VPARRRPRSVSLTRSPARAPPAPYSRSRLAIEDAREGIRAGAPRRNGRHPRLRPRPHPRLAYRRYPGARICAPSSRNHAVTVRAPVTARRALASVSWRAAPVRIAPMRTATPCRRRRAPCYIRALPTAPPVGRIARHRVHRHRSSAIGNHASYISHSRLNHAPRRATAGAIAGGSTRCRDGCSSAWRSQPSSASR